MDDYFEERMRCQLCTRDAVVTISGKFSGEERTFVVCSGCVEEFRRIRRTWAIGGLRQSADEGIVIPRDAPGYDDFPPGPFTVLKPRDRLPELSLEREENEH
jgi:hypothetical protein